MAFDDLDKLRERTPAGLEVVRDIIAVVELGLSRTDPQCVGRYSLAVGDLAITIGHWNAPPRRLDTPSEAHRTTTISLVGHRMSGRSNPSLLYDIQGCEANFEPSMPVILPGEQAPAEGPFVNCTAVEMAGKPSDETSLLFADQELDSLDPSKILRRLELFHTMAGIALTSSKAE